jgi:hypothetical protein
MSEPIDDSRANVEYILENGIESKEDRRALRQYLEGIQRGRGNARLHVSTHWIVRKIRDVLGVDMLDTRSPEMVQKPKREELREKREKKELSPFDFDLNFLYQLAQADAPLTRKDLEHETGLQAVVLTRADLDTLGGFDIIYSNGERISIEPEQLGKTDVLILYPSDLGNLEININIEVPKPAALTNESVVEETLRLGVFADVQDVVISEHAAWTDILRVHGTSPAMAIIEGRKKAVPERYIRAFAFHECIARAKKRDYGFIARFLENMKLGTQDEVAYFKGLAG